jgi:hypothetical protein
MKPAPVEQFTSLYSIGFDTTAPTKTCLWPAPYDEDTGEAAFRFITECWWTLNEADQKIDLVPAKPYVEALCHEWHGAFVRRQALLIEKSRRLIVSWISRGLETWQMGLSLGEAHIVDQTHENSAEHLWRIHFALGQLRDKRPEFQLAKHEVRGSPAAKQATHVILPNGSLITQGHQDAISEQGKGKTIVTLEEISKYRSPSAFWGQALIVTQGSAAGRGGWVCGIANASPVSEWQEIKGFASAREMLGLE